MEESPKNEILNIENKIYVIRGKEVMLDSDLAKLYQVETKQLNRQVKRNIDRFDDDFMFQLSEIEYESLRCQIGTSKEKGGRRYLPYVFTEMGVTTLASILHSDVAIDMSKKIIRAFVKMRHFLIDNKDIYKSLNNINNILLEHDEKLDYLFRKFDKKEYLYLENTEYDAYSDIIKIFKTSKESITVIDPYVDISFLDTIRNLKTSVTLITQRRTKLTKTEIDKYNKQYNNLTVIKDSSFHDRYLIIDNQDIYHLGASINHAGNKVFSINKLEDSIIKITLIDYINKII